MKKFFTKKTIVETPEPEPEKNSCEILLCLKDGNLTVYADWADGVDPKVIGSLIGVVATGEVLGPILNEISAHLQANNDEDAIEIVHDTIRERVRQFQENSNEENDEPVVSPINAIRRQLTMYQSGE